MNKKLTSILLASTMVLSLGLTACGGDKQPTEESKAPVAESNAPAPESKAPETTEKGKIAYIVGNLGDKSFNDSGERGMETLRSEGWDVKTIETGDSSNADKYDDFIRDAIDQGYEYLVASSTYTDNFLAIAPEYPDNKFLVFDDSPDLTGHDNVSYIAYAQNEGSYLVGMMAAGMSETGTVAVNVGMENPVINDFVTGFIEGVKAKDPDCKVVTAACGSWSDPVIMKTLCLDQQRNNNADVFYQVAGGSGDGLFEAAMETGTWAIGVDSDQYQTYKDSANPEKADVILTSMLKEVGNSFIAFFHTVEDGTAEWGKGVTLGLADNAVGYVDNAFFQEKVPQDLRDEMAGVAEKVKSGELKIKSYFDFASEAEYMAYRDAAK